MLALSRLPGSVAIVAALSVCLTTWFQIAPWADRHLAMLMTPLYVATLSAALVLAALIAQRDVWLGAFVGLVTLRGFIAPPPQSLHVVLWTALGIGLVALVQTGLSDSQATWARRGLVALAVAQCLYALPQLVRIDPLWVGLHSTRIAQIHGTFENSRALAGVLAMIAPLAAWWLLPLLVGVVVLSQSFLASVALAVGLALRYRARWLVVPAVFAVPLLTVHLRGLSTDSTSMRLAVWGLALEQWGRAPWSVLVGRGPAAWFAEVPDAQVRAIAGSAPDAYFMAHNDAVHLLYNYGVVALLPLAGWVWTHRAVLARPAALGSLAALGIFAMGMSPLHLPTTGTLAALVVGLAARPDVLSPTRDRPAATLGVGQRKQAT